MTPDIFKGIVHLKIKILSSLMSFDTWKISFFAKFLFLLKKHKRRYSKECLFHLILGWKKYSNMTSFLKLLRKLTLCYITTKSWIQYFCVNLLFFFSSTVFFIFLELIDTGFIDLSLCTSIFKPKKCFICGYSFCSYKNKYKTCVNWKKTSW